MTNKCLAELEPGDSLYDLLILRSKLNQKKKDGDGPDLKLSIFDGSKEWKAKIWKATPAEIQEIAQNNFLLITGNTDPPKDGFPGEITIKSYKVAQRPENVEPFLSSFPGAHDENLERFKVLLKSVHDPNLVLLLREIFNPQDRTWKQFKSAVAARSRHHAYRGGLLEHSVEVAELCDSSCQVLTHLRRDFLVTCGLLHDIGKLEEMDHGLAAGEFTESGTLVGHTVSGAHLIGNAADKIDNFPKNLKLGLMHMVLSHHGNPEWGAAQTPACAEAFVLHECDNMSAKAHEWHKVAANALPGQFSVKVGPKDYYYIGDLGLQAPAFPVTKLQPVRIFSIQPQKEAMQTFRTAHLPIKGMVAAGSPDQSSDEEQETREVTTPKNGADYLLKVTGDSMVDAGIFPGDLLFVKSQQTGNHDEIVIANAANQGDVVKRLRREKHGNNGLDQDWLDSENRSANYDPIRADENTHIHGIVVGLLKA